MRKLLKIEMHRAFYNPWLAAALVFGILIAVSHVAFHVWPLTVYIGDGDYPLSVFQHWLGGENTSVQPVLYFLIAPLLSAMPYLSTLHEDRHSGYIKNIFTRTGAMGYYGVKYITAFLVSGFVAVIPLLFNFLLTAMLLPAAAPQAYTGLYPINQLSLMGDMFYENPLLYIALYLLLDFVFFGLLATVGLLCSFVTDHVFVVMLCPFIVYLISFAVTQLTGFHEYCPYAFLRPSQPVAGRLSVVAGEMAVLLVLGGIYFAVAKKKETY